MAEPTTPLPDIGYADDEWTMLRGFLDFYRVALARKAEGIDDRQARMAACPPSDLTLLGLIRHMADVERSWFRRYLENEDAPPIFHGDAHPDGDQDGDFHAPAGDTLADALAVYRAEIGVADAHLDRRGPGGLDDLGAAGEGDRPSVRWLLIHMIEEYARHAGHADLLRQAVDGVTGD